MKRTIKVTLALLPAIAVVTFVLLRGQFSAADKPENPPPSSNVNSVEQPGGSASRFGITGIISYTVRDADGNLKDGGTIQNAVNDEGKNEVFNRITGTASGGAYDAIAALDVAVGTDDPVDGVLASSIALDLDGDSGDTNTHENPADGTVTTDFGTETGNGTVQVTYTARTDGVSVMQIVLTKAAEDDTAVGGAAAIADSDIFAYVDVPDITLNTDDTVQYTWTVDVD